MVDEPTKNPGANPGPGGTPSPTNRAPKAAVPPAPDTPWWPGNPVDEAAQPAPRSWRDPVQGSLDTQDAPVDQGTNPNADEPPNRGSDPRGPSASWRQSAGTQVPELDPQTGEPRAPGEPEEPGMGSKLADAGKSAAKKVGAGLTAAAAAAQGGGGSGGSGGGAGAGKAPGTGKTGAGGPAGKGAGKTGAPGAPGARKQPAGLGGKRPGAGSGNASGGRGPKGQGGLHKNAIKGAAMGAKQGGLPGAAAGAVAQVVKSGNGKKLVLVALLTSPLGMAMIGFMVLIMIATTLSGGSISNTQAVDTGSVATGVSPGDMEAYQSASTATGVPWEILLAVSSEELGDLPPKVTPSPSNTAPGITPPPGAPTPAPTPSPTPTSGDYVGPFLVSASNWHSAKFTDAQSRSVLTQATWVGQQMVVNYAKTKVNGQPGDLLGDPTFGTGALFGEQDTGQKSTPPPDPQLAPETKKWVTAISSLPLKGMNSTLASAAFALAISWYVGTAVSPGGCDGSSSAGGTPANSDSGVAITVNGKSETLNGQQVTYAADIVQAIVSEALPAVDQKQAETIALMVALQESSLQEESNLKVPGSDTLPHEAVSSDHYSVGIFQQQPTPHGGWGVYTEAMNPTQSTLSFLGAKDKPADVTAPGLESITGWQTMDPGTAAQKVQVSATPTAYTKWLGAATTLINSVHGVACTSGSPPVSGSAASLVLWDSYGDGIPYSQCRPGCASITGVNNCFKTGYAPSCKLTEEDCSGLQRWAFWNAIGIDIGGDTKAQLAYAVAHNLIVDTTSNVVADVSKLQAGDLIIFAASGGGSDPKSTLTEHVAMYIGNGEVNNATQPGELSHIGPIYNQGPWMWVVRFNLTG